MKKIVISVLIVLLLFVIPALPGEIHDAAKAGDLAKIKKLLAENPELVNNGDKAARTALHFAAAGGHKETVAFLLSKGARVNAKDAGGYTALSGAVIYGQLAAAALLLEKGADIEAKNDYGRTPLLLVARERGNFACARLLVEKGADINAKDKYGAAPLDLAAWRGFEPIVNLLLDKGAKIPAGVRRENLLIYSVSKRLIKLFKLLTAKGVELDFKTGGGTLLHSAAAGGSAEIVTLLIEKGFDVNQKNRYQWTPLHYAAEKGRREAAAALMEKGAELNARTSLGKTAFNIAVEWGYKEVSELLAAREADPGPQRFPVLKGEYLGMKKPGLEPEIFAPGIISEHLSLHGSVVFSPDGREVYWALSVPPRESGYATGVIKTMSLKNGCWTPPRTASFSGKYDDDVPFISVDGGKLYFISFRPTVPGGRIAKENIFFMARKEGGWSAPEPFDPVVNGTGMHWQFSLDKKGNIYFGGRGIYCSRFVKGRYNEPEKLFPGSSPFISPDGSYLIYDAESKQSKSIDLFVRFRTADGSWSAPHNLGKKINTPGHDICPVVSPDGKYLFYLSSRNGVEGVYWVDAKIINNAAGAAGGGAPSLIKERGMPIPGAR